MLVWVFLPVTFYFSAFLQAELNLMSIISVDTWEKKWCLVTNKFLRCLIYSSLGYLMSLMLEDLLIYFLRKSDGNASWMNSSLHISVRNDETSGCQF